RAVDGLRVFPEARGHELGEQALAVEDLLQLRGALLERRRVLVDVRHGVVVVKLHAVEAEFPVLAQLGGEGDLLADLGAERVAAGADVPGAEGEAVGALAGRGHSSFLHEMPMKKVMQSPAVAAGAWPVTNVQVRPPPPV